MFLDGLGRIVNNIDRKKMVLEIQNGKTNKVRKSFTVDPDIYQKFIGECRLKKVSGSSVIEHFIRLFLGNEEL